LALILYTNPAFGCYVK